MLSHFWVKTTLSKCYIIKLFITNSDIIESENNKNPFKYTQTEKKIKLSVLHFQCQKKRKKNYIKAVICI